VVEDALELVRRREVDVLAVLERLGGMARGPVERLAGGEVLVAVGRVHPDAALEHVAQCGQGHSRRAGPSWRGAGRHGVNVTSRTEAQHPRAPLRRETIIAAAAQLVERDGLEALSMRKVAAGLGVEAMSL